MHTRREDHLDAPQQRLRFRPAHDLILEALEAHAAVERRRRNAVLHAELTFEPRRGTVMDQRRGGAFGHPDNDRVDLGVAVLAGCGSGEGRIERPVRHVAAGIFLDADAGSHEVKCLARLGEPIGAEVLRRGEQGAEAEGRLEYLRVGGEAGRCEKRCLQTGAGRQSGVQRLGHGAEVLA